MTLRLTALFAALQATVTVSVLRLLAPGTVEPVDWLVLVTAAAGAAAAAWRWPSGVAIRLEARQGAGEGVPREGRAGDTATRAVVAAGHAARSVATSAEGRAPRAVQHVLDGAAARLVLVADRRDDAGSVALRASTTETDA